MLLELTIAMVFIYVDDFRIAMQPIPYGMSYSHPEQKWTHCKIREQIEKQHLSPESNTKSELANIMNGVSTDLKFTTESQSDFSDNWLPTLDCKIRLTRLDNKQRVEYTFYEKPGNCPFTTIETSAVCKQAMNQQLMEVTP